MYQIYIFYCYSVQQGIIIYWNEINRIMRLSNSRNADFYKVYFICLRIVSFPFLEIKKRKDAKENNLSVNFLCILIDFMSHTFLRSQMVFALKQIKKRTAKQYMERESK